MAYIESHQSLPTHRKTLRLWRLLGMDRFCVVGRLMALWWWALDNAQEGYIAASDADILADVMGWSGEVSALCDALVASHFMELVKVNGEDTFIIHDWFDYARFVERVERHPVRVEWEGVRRKVVAYLLDRDGHRCQECGTTEGPLEIDHIVPIARGGQNEPGNLRELCRTCNRRKGAS